MSAKPQATYELLKASGAEARDALSPPRWAVELVAGAQASPKHQVNGGPGVDLLDAGDFALASARIPDAVMLAADALQRRVTEVYGAIAARIRTLGAKHPVRLWNHIPSIHERMDDRRDRYMVFNAGRYEAFTNWYGGTQGFDQDVATASGIGHNGRDLVVHCLSAASAGVAVANPRQIAPHRYSAKYGPLPPCFARATVLAEAGLVLVGGTASIRGEDSLHGTSLPLQLRETLTNLASVVETAEAKVGGAVLLRSQQDWLARYREVRVYYPCPGDAQELEALLQGAFGATCRVEMRRADLCRAELLVEIEGVAQLRG
jgi:enamine deaminase RidA (YjgF/YER057c/UK114 family)